MPNKAAKNKGGRPRKVPIYREGKPATDAFLDNMRRVLNPMPVKKQGS